MASSRMKKSDPLNKRIPENPRYQHIGPTVDTGASVRKYLEKLEDIKKNYRYRNDEIFRRIKVTTFAQLVLQIAEQEEENMSPLPTIERPYPVTPQFTPHTPDLPPNSARSTLSSVVMGIGEMDVGSYEASPPSQPTPPPSSSPPPYLLLDVRDRDSFDQCHIISAVSYPATTLSRSCNYFTRDILEYKSKPGRIIILYDENERVAPGAATTFVQRQVDNVFVLSGGLKVLHRTFPEGFITGSVPASCQLSPLLSARRKASSTPQKRSPSSPYLAPASPHRQMFTWEDVNTIQMRLEEVLLASMPSSRASSRGSTVCSSARTTSRVDSRAVSTQPWK